MKDMYKTNQIDLTLTIRVEVNTPIGKVRGVEPNFELNSLVESIQQRLRQVDEACRSPHKIEVLREALRELVHDQIKEEYFKGLYEVLPHERKEEYGPLVWSDELYTLMRNMYINLNGMYVSAQTPTKVEIEITTKGEYPNEEVHGVVLLGDKILYEEKGGWRSDIDYKLREWVVQNGYHSR